MRTGLGPVKDYVEHSERDKSGRKGERERYLTPEQQAAALEFWKRHDVDFTMPADEQKPVAQEVAWYWERSLEMMSNVDK